MEQVKIEINLEGEFTTIDVSLEGKEIPLREVDDNVFHKLFTGLEVDGDLDLHVRLKGFIGMDWKIEIIVNDDKVFERESTFNSKGFVTFTEIISL